MPQANSKGIKKGPTRVPKTLADSRKTAEFIREKAAKPKKFYFQVGLAEDPNKFIGLSNKKRKKIAKPTEESATFLKNLENKANRTQKKRFKYGKVMCEELEYYIQKYGDDYAAMARDKRNVYQDSPGQIRYKINKYIKIHKSD